MGRDYPCWLLPASTQRFPGRVICLECRVNEVSPRLSRERATERLASWHLRELRKKGSGYVCFGDQTGQTADGFWQAVLDGKSKHFNTYILSHIASRDWTLLCLWEMLERGTLTIGGEYEEGTEKYQAGMRRLRLASRDSLGPLSSGSMLRMQSYGRGFICCESPPDCCSVRNVASGKRVTWTDTRNFAVGLEKLPSPGSPLPLRLAEWFTDYYRYAIGYKLGSFQTTLGSQALTAWKFGYYSPGVLHHANTRAGQEESRSYYGGRCEAFCLGPVQGTCYSVDMRAAYGSVCHDHALPVRLDRMFDGKRGPCSIRDSDCQRTIATVQIETTEPAYPYRRDDDIIYPVGRFTTTLCGPELIDAIKLGRVRRVLSYTTYELDYALREYAAALHRMRQQAEQEGNSGIATVAKGLTVAICGKFAQQQRQWIPMLRPGGDILYGEVWGEDEAKRPLRMRAIAGHWSREERDGYCLNSVTAISAWINSAARIKLLGLIRTAGWENVYYVDTDGMLTNATGYVRLGSPPRDSSGELGSCRLVESGQNTCIAGIKSYVCGNRRVLAGIPASLRDSSIGQGEGQQYATPWSFARRGKRPEVVALSGNRERASEYHHGVVHADGTVSPIELKEW